MHQVNTAFNRPDLPGRDIDATFAPRVEQLPPVEQQQALEEFRLSLRLRRSLRPLTQPLPAPPIIARPAGTSYRSEVRLGVVYTTCEQRQNVYRVETKQ